MAKATETALNNLHSRLDALEASGVDITKLATGKRNLVAESLAADTKRFKANQAKAIAAAAANWSVGQSVRTRTGLVGTITAIEGAALVLDFNGDTRKFAASMVRAA